MLIDLITGGRSFTADPGAPAGGSPAPDPNGNASGQPGQPAQPQNGGTSPKAEKTFTQAELEAILADRLSREQRKAQDAADKARRDAEAAALAEQGQFKTLAEQRQAELDALKPKAEQTDRYEKALRAHLDEQRKGLPEHLTALLDKMDVAEQLEYLAANRAKLVPETAPPPAPNINGGGGNGSTAPDPKQREAELRQRFRLGR